MNPPKFEYVISFEDPVLIVSFMGTLAKSTLADFGACQAEVFRTTQARYVILSFQPGFRIEKGGIPDFIVFQKQLQDRQRTFRICNVSEELAGVLLEHRALREELVAPDVLSCMRGFQAMWARERR